METELPPQYYSSIDEGDPLVTPMNSTNEDLFEVARFDDLFDSEDRHFWFRGRNRVIEHYAQKFASSQCDGFRALEVGCGTGNTLRVMSKAAGPNQLIGMDLHREGLRFAKRRHICPLVCGDMMSPPFSKPFDLIGIFDVIEHLPDDRQALADIARILKPRGSILLTVPAHQSLWSYHDEAAGHRRRYGRQDLESKLREAGFSIDVISPFMMSMLPLIWARRIPAALSRKTLDPDQVKSLRKNELRIVPVVNFLLNSLLQAEAAIARRGWRIPAGSSLLALAHRHEDGVES